MEKKTYAQLKAERDIALHNSNLSNLVSASNMADRTIAELEHDLQWWREQKQKIDEAGDNAETMKDTETVHELYTARPPVFKHREW